MEGMFEYESWWILLNKQILIIRFCVAHYQNFNSCLLKLTEKSNAIYCLLSNSVIKTKMMKVIVTISSENVGQIISVGQIILTEKIPTYLKIVS